MRILIAIPTLDTVPVHFLASMVQMDRPEGTDVAIVSNSLIYDARTRLALQAVKDGFDRVLWLDSDMVFNHNLLKVLSADLDEGREMVCGLFFTRRKPTKPCVYKCIQNHLKNGRAIPWVIPYNDYPEDQIFRVAGCGFGAVMMSTDLIRRVAERHRQPFWPEYGFGEDISFCIRAAEAGAEIWCDSRIKVGHAGYHVYGEDTWKEQQ